PGPAGFATSPIELRLRKGARNVTEPTGTPEDVLDHRASRRAFLRASALGLTLPIAGTALAACSSGEADAAAPGAAASHSNGHAAAPAAPAAAATRTPEEIRAAADEMDRMHEEGIKSFPA